MTARKQRDPVGEIAESLFQARQDVDGNRRRRLDAVHESFVEADGDVPPEDFESGFAFYVERARASQRAL